MAVGQARAGPSGRPPVFITDRVAMERDVVALGGPEGRHAATVRRLRPGERADLIDGDGMLAECVVAAARGPALARRRPQRLSHRPRPGSLTTGRSG